MCQLTLINTENEQLNKLIAAVLIPLNANTEHVDGTGFANFTENPPILKKTKIRASGISNYAEYFSPCLVGDKPIFGHVRKSTVKTTVTDEASHPFYNEKSQLTLAHNGTLVIRDYEIREQVDKLYPGMIDSEVFLEDLSNNYMNKKNKAIYKNLPKALKETMENFSGKFAFLIHEGFTDKTYVVRGYLATLYKADLFINDIKIGQIINTESVTFRKALYLLRTIWNSFNDSDLSFNEPMIIAHETIFEVRDRDIVVLDKIIENKTIFERPKVIGGKEEEKDDKKEYTKIYEKYIGEETSPHFGVSAIDAKLQSLYAVMNTLWLSPEEVDMLAIVLFSKPLVKLGLKEANDFINVLEELEIHLLDTVPELDNMIDVWDSLVVKSGYSSPKYVYEEFEEIEFPFFVNSYETLQRIEKDIIPVQEL